MLKKLKKRRLNLKKYINISNIYLKINCIKIGERKKLNVFIFRLSFFPVCRLSASNHRTDGFVWLLVFYF